MRKLEKTVKIKIDGDVNTPSEFKSIKLGELKTLLRELKINKKDVSRLEKGLIKNGYAYINTNSVDIAVAL